jgi:hypothetical protein
MFDTRIFYLLNTKKRLKIFSITFCLLILLIGFFSSTFITSVLGSNKTILIFVAFYFTFTFELFGFFRYSIKKKILRLFFYCNYWKLGFIFGLFVDAFKLGS